MITELPTGVRFSLDTSCLVTAWRVNYPPTMAVFRPLWDHLTKLLHAGIVVATSVVHRELKRKDDEVLEWCNQYPVMFLDLIPELQARVRDIEREFPKILKGQRNEADPFVIALALLKNPPLTVVTQEVLGQANAD